MVASDKGYPPMSDEAMVTVNVARNLNAPRFSKSLYTVTIPEGKSVGAEIFRMAATDLDNVSVVNLYGQPHSVRHGWLFEKGVMECIKNALVETSSPWVNCSI